MIEHQKDISKGTYNTIIDDENYIDCNICNTRIHCHDIETHIATHNYDYNGDNVFYTMPKTVEELTRSTYTGKGDDIECKICYVDYNADDILIYLSCSHRYHENCILAWINKQRSQDKEISCPICDKNVFQAN